MKYIRIISICLLFISFLGCSKVTEPLSWDSNYTVPLLHGSLGLEDLVPDSLITLDADSSLVLTFEGNLLDMDLSEILVIPDTILRDTFQAPFPSPVDFAPGQTFIDIPEEQNLQINGVYLKSAKIASGVVTYELQSTVQGVVTYTYEIPSAIDWMGNQFTKSITVPAASSGSTETVSGSFDLNGYYLDMTGQSGNNNNVIETVINCKISTSNSSPVAVSSADVIIVNNKFESIIIEEAEGYFGNHSISTGLEYSTIEGFSKWVSGEIDIDELDVDLTLKNGVGVDIFIRLNQLVAQGGDQNVSLVSGFLGELISLSRATRYFDSIVPSTYDIEMDQSSSNIDNFLETLPHQIGYDLDVEVNPLGNVSGFNDFYDRDAPIGVYINASMPLDLIANNLTLEDTLKIEIGDEVPLNSLILDLEVENGFPLEAEVQLAILDQNNKIISRVFSPSQIEAASLGSNDRVDEVSIGLHEIRINGLDLERIRSHGKVLLTVVFNTPGSDHLTLYNSYRLNYKVHANANVTITARSE